jgi:hypothetical protein
MLEKLPAASSVGAAATMKAATTVELAPSMRRRETMESPASAHGCAAAGPFTMPSAFSMKFAATAESVIMSVPTASIVARPATVKLATTIEATAAVETMKPRTRANKHAPGKIVRTVVAVWRACVWGIPIVAIGTDWRRLDVGRPNGGRPESHCNPNLRVGCTRHNHANPKQNSVL